MGYQAINSGENGLIVRGKINSQLQEIYDSLSGLNITPVLGSFAALNGNILTIAGSDVPTLFADKCNLKLSGVNDAATINTFLADYTVGIYTVVFFGTINGSGYLYKPLNCNFDGYHSTIKMLPGLNGTKYIMGITPIVGDHKHTFIKGFELDGNVSAYAAGSLNALTCGLGFHYYDDLQLPTVEYDATNVDCEDLYIHDWIRSCFLPGTGWRCKNISLANSRDDHLLYISGAKNVIVENLYCSGYSAGIIAISGANYTLNTTPPENIVINNVTLDNCTYGAAVGIHIRGRFLGAGAAMTLPSKNVSIRNVKVYSSTPYAELLMQIGHGWDTGAAGGQCENITVDGLNVECETSATLIHLMRGRNIKVKGNFNITNSENITPLILLTGGGLGRNNYDFSGSDFIVSNYTNSTNNKAIFGVIDNQNVVGLNIANVSITNADAIKRVSGTAQIVNLNKQMLVGDKVYNPNTVTIATTNEL